MPRPKAHYSLAVKDHVSGKQLKVELIDLPFSEVRRFRVRVNGQWARKVPLASKSLVLRQVRGWLGRCSPKHHAILHRCACLRFEKSSACNAAADFRCC